MDFDLDSISDDDLYIDAMLEAAEEQLGIPRSGFERWLFTADYFGNKN